MNRLKHWTIIKQVQQLGQHVDLNQLAVHVMAKRLTILTIMDVEIVGYALIPRLIMHLLQQLGQHVDLNQLVAHAMVKRLTIPTIMDVEIVVHVLILRVNHFNV